VALVAGLRTCGSLGTGKSLSFVEASPYPPAKPETTVMRSSIRTLALLSILFTTAGPQSAVAQISINSDASGKSRTFMVGEITMRADLPTTNTASFTSTPVHPLKKGDKVAAMTAQDQAWSVDRHPLQVGRVDIAYPVLATVKCSDGNFRTLYPAILKAKKDIRAGETLHADGYSIESSHAIMAGDSIPIIVVSSSYLSLEASEGSKVQSQAKPWLTVFKEDMKPEERSSAIEAWRIEAEHVSK
jgi:hypothetical protein